MGKFLNNVSVPESLGKLYGKHVQAIAGIGTVLGSVGYIAIQFRVIYRLETLKMYPEIDIATVKKAIQLIKEHHAGVKRKSGEPFYLHPIAVAHILLHYTQDQDTVIAALLHDTVEDTLLSLAQIGGMFNESVQHIEDGVLTWKAMLKHKKGCLCLLMRIFRSCWT
jgi:hypothetical protein